MSVCLYRQQLRASTLHVSITSLCLHLKFISVWAEWFQAGWQTTSISFSRDQHSQMGLWKQCPPAADKVHRNTGHASSHEDWLEATEGSRELEYHRHSTGQGMPKSWLPLQNYLPKCLPWHFLWTKAICHLTWELQICTTLTAVESEISLLINIILLIIYLPWVFLK